MLRASGRAVPVFNDKHLSWNWEWAKEMYDTAQRTGLPSDGGVEPAGDVAHAVRSKCRTGARVDEALCVCYGGVDSYDFHGLETIQCMVERRRGGETGVKWMQAYRGENFWKAYKEGVWPPRSDGSGAVPQPYPDAGARRLQRHLAYGGGHAAVW